MGFIIIMYCLFCYSVIMGLDDDKDWGFGDYALFVFAPCFVPVVVGGFIGKKIREHISKSKQ